MEQKKRMRKTCCVFRVSWRETWCERWNDSEKWDTHNLRLEPWATHVVWVHRAKLCRQTVNNCTRSNMACERCTCLRPLSVFRELIVSGKRKLHEQEKNVEITLATGSSVQNLLKDFSTWNVVVLLPVRRWRRTGWSGWKLKSPSSSRINCVVVVLETFEFVDDDVLLDLQDGLDYSLRRYFQYVRCTVEDTCALLHENQGVALLDLEFLLCSERRDRTSYIGLVLQV